jgi:hypothetical protein
MLYLPQEGVLIDQGENHLLIPLSNIACVRYSKAQAKPVVGVKRGA